MDAFLKYDEALYSKMIASNALMEIKAQSETPRIIGFQPADFILSMESPAPIKNKVSTKSDFEILVMLNVITSGMAT